MVKSTIETCNSVFVVAWNFFRDRTFVIQSLDIRPVCHSYADDMQIYINVLASGDHGLVIGNVWHCDFDLQVMRWSLWRNNIKLQFALILAASRCIFVAVHTSGIECCTSSRPDCHAEVLSSRVFCPSVRSFVRSSVINRINRFWC